MEIGDVLTKKPILSVEIEVERQYEKVCKKYLEEQGCSMQRTRPGWFQITFPEGTREEERLGMSGMYTKHSYIVLPTNVELSLIIAAPINERQTTSRVTMGFPKEIFE